MRARSLTLAILALALGVVPALRAQAMPGMDMSQADASMSGKMMPTAHMTMTPLAKPQPGDSARAAAIVDTVRVAIAKYRDYHAALDDGFTIFMPKVPQKVYHFTSKSNGFLAAFRFDPSKPTSLLYKKNPDGGFTLVGAMFTARKRSTPEELNARVPLSVAEWHMHTNLCIPPKAEREAMRDGADTTHRFGFFGSITTEAACTAAGGTFMPTVFGWMVHVNPFESDPRLVWGTHEEHGEM
ncbi:MAG: hypothetical protein ACREMU_14575 [Gemmatimonadaceae bacterium]